MLKLATAAFVLGLCLPSASKAQDGGWRIGMSNEGTHLLDSAPAVDRLYRLSCPYNGGPVGVTVVFDNPPGTRRWRATRPTSLTITTPALSVTVRGQVEPVVGTPYVEATLPAGAPIFAAFRRTGRIQFTAIGQTLTPAAAEPSIVAEFLRSCRRAQ